MAKRKTAAGGTRKQAMGASGRIVQARVGGELARINEHAAGIDMVEAFAINEEKREPLLRRQVLQIANRERIERLAVVAVKERCKARSVGLS